MQAESEKIPALNGALDQLRSRLGDHGARWCERAPGLFADLMAGWQLTETGEPAWAGHAGVALPVTRADGTPAVLKASATTAPIDLENVMLACWNGRRAARLLARDDDQHARLLQRLGHPSLAEQDDPVEIMTITGDLAACLAQPAPAQIPRLADLTSGFATAIAADAATRLARRDHEIAAATYRDLSADQPDTLLHGDLQGRNVLRSPDGSWSVIDPLGLVGEPALEALTILRDRWADLPNCTSPRQELVRRLAAFAEAAGADLSRVLAWTHALCVRAVVANVRDDHGLHAWVASQLSH